MRTRRLFLFTGIVVLLTAACAPAVAPGSRQDVASGATTGPKLLRMGVTFDDEPKDFEVAFGSIGAGGTETRYLLNAPLTIFDDKATLMPRVAESVPTIENGGWTVTPDGRMQTVWKLRPDVVWHDGTPLSAEDFILGLRVASDPEWALGTRITRSIDEIDVPDPHTLVVKWKNIEILANQVGLNIIPPVARHIMAEPFATLDKAAFAAHPYWGDEFIGIGPYRMGRWLRGSSMEIIANDNYFLGRPKIDRMIFTYYGDSRGLLVATMAGEVDVIPVGYMKAEEAFVLKTQWEPTGVGSIMQSNVKLRNGYWQWRDPSAPWVPDVRVRLAMLHLIDRQNLVDTLHNGLSGVDDIFWPKEHPVYQLARQRGLPDTSYNPDRAHRLLAEAGVTRGADGMYRTSSGTPFTLEATTSGDINTNVQELIAIASAWQTAGLQTSQNIITTNTEAREIEATTRGVRMTSEALDFVGYDGALTSEVASAATRWRGRNSGGYTNPAYDDMHKRMMSTVDLAQQNSMGADLVKFQLDNLVYLPLVYSPSFSANRTNVRGLTHILPYQRLNAWNVHTWEMG